MSIDIDFTMAPPTLADISEKREQAVSERAVYRKRNIRFHITMLTIVLSWVAFVIIVILPMLSKAKPDWGMATYFFPYFTFFIFIIGNDLHIKRIEKPSKLLDKSIAALTEGSVDEIDTIIKVKEQPDEFASYLEQVASQGRSLVRAEMDEILKWRDANSLTK